MISSNINGVKKVEMSNYVLSQIGTDKAARVSDNVVSGMKQYYNLGDSPVVSTTYQTQNVYRSRIKNLYNNLEGIKPIDGEINSVLYTDNYMEKGVAIKPSVGNLKQLWVEYRLMYNEYVKRKEGKKEMFESMNTYQSEKKELDGLLASRMEPVKVNSSYVLDNFDEIYARLEERVNGANKYVDDLVSMREELNHSTDALELEKRSLEKERKDFETYKEEQMTVIEEEKKKIEDNSKKLQDLIDGFENKIKDIL